MATDYGLDISMSPAATDMDAMLGFVSGRRCLSEALARRLQTPRGRLIDDPDYGYDLTGELGDDLGTGDLARIASLAAQECAKDERVISAQGNATLTAGTLTVAIQVQDGAGPFTLVLAVSDVTVALLQPG